MAETTTSDHVRNKWLSFFDTLFGMDVLPVFLAFLGTLVIMFHVVRQGMERQQVQTAFYQAAEHASPQVQDAIAQVASCERLAIEHSWHDWQRVLWFPCVQQGDDRLRSLNADTQIPELHQRLVPVQAVLARQLPS